MGWETGPGPAGRGRPTWSSEEWSRAAALCAAQFPAVGLWAFILASSADDYGAYGGALGVACLLVTAPVVVPCLGLVHATLHIMPTAVLARLRPPHWRGPEWIWHLAASVSLGAGAAVAARTWWGAPLVETAAWLTGIGVLPVLGLAYLRGRRWERGIWWRSAGAGVVLAVLTGLAGLALIDDYTPPRLSAGQLAGSWRGAEGAVLTLRPDGTAEASRMPVSSGAIGGGTACDGLGTWALVRAGEDDRYRDGPRPPGRRLRAGVGLDDRRHRTGPRTFRAPRRPGRR
ncbi:hypothetical protein [Streptomyces violaceorubidus]|uniref:hypothetical protein n=1 Tax=Streptomyces violaceorubidus TaxID=284042 RepID=UPI000A84537C|nr:hypothetical protein [Streptomyces violaceorubidus]